MSVDDAYRGYKRIWEYNDDDVDVVDDVCIYDEYDDDEI